MSRVFIQAYCSYPHGGALANFIQNLTKAVLYLGYDVLLLTDINKEYSFEDVILANSRITVIPIVASEDGEISRRQKQTGFCDERIGALKRYNICREDRIMIFWLKNEYFLEKLFELEREIGFKSICGVLEFYHVEDYASEEKYKKDVHIEREVYLGADAVLAVSEYVCKYYMEKGMPAYCFPPMVDSSEYPIKRKEMDKYKVIIPSQKDSLQSMIRAFLSLPDIENCGVELHLSGVNETIVREMFSDTDWGRLTQFLVIHSWLAYDELIELYQQMHFILVARHTCQRTLANFPSKVPEAMIYGVVPIASDVGDYTKYYLQDGYDSIFIQGDTQDNIRKAVIKALSLDNKDYSSYSENAKKTARIKFDYHLWVPKIEEMLKNV